MCCLFCNSSGTKCSHPNNASACSAISHVADECINLILEWLSLLELHAFGETCKRFQAITNQYVQQKYPAISISCKNDGSQVYYRQLNSFGHPVQNIFPLCRVSQRFFTDKTIGDQCLKYIRINGASTRDIQIVWSNNVLPKIAVLELINFKIKSHSYENFLKFGVNLKRLKMQNLKIGTSLKGKPNQWLLEQYPLLEHFELSLHKVTKMTELKTFFQQNRTVRQFTTNKSFFCANMESIQQAAVQLDKLTIEIDNGPDYNVLSMFDTLNEFHKSGFYKHLHLSGIFQKQQIVNAMASLGGLEKLSIGVCDGNYDFSKSVHLKYLNILWVSSLVNIERLAQNLMNLEEICIWKASLNDILPFVRHSVHLKQLKIYNFTENTTQSENYTLNFETLYKLRKQLDGACKLTIFIEENIFLATKRLKIHNVKIIDIKLVKSPAWGNHFLWN